MDTLPLWLLAAIFVGCAAVIWVAGIQLSDTTDVLDDRLHLGSALGGARSCSRSPPTCPRSPSPSPPPPRDHIGVAIGNILGGIAIQTVVLVALDAFGSAARAHPLTYRAASLGLVLEGGLVVAVLAVAVMGTPTARRPARRARSPRHRADRRPLAGRGAAAEQGRQGTCPGSESGDAPDAPAAAEGHAKHAEERPRPPSGTSRPPAPPSCSPLAALATLAAGYYLEQSGDAIAGHIGLTGVLFGSTVLAAATSLPELSTGLTSVKLGDVQLAISDIFGGNAFLPVLFLVATLISGTPVLPQAQSTDIYLTGARHPAHRRLHRRADPAARPHAAGMGPDSLAVLVLYAARHRRTRRHHPG